MWHPAGVGSCTLSQGCWAGNGRPGNACAQVAKMPYLPCSRAGADRVMTESMTGSGEKNPTPLGEHRVLVRLQGATDKDTLSIFALGKLRVSCPWHDLAR